jgi:PAS domain S-box-containing protein
MSSVPILSDRNVCAAVSQNYQAGHTIGNRLELWFTFGQTLVFLLAHNRCMRTRAVGNGPSPESGSRLEQRDLALKYVDSKYDIAEPKNEEFSSSIADYCSQFQGVADTAQQMMWRFGADGQCKYFNRSWLEFRGRTAEQERGAGWLEGVHPEDVKHCTTSYSCGFETRQPFYLEFRVKRADASYAWIHAHGVPQYVLDGSFVGYVGVLEETRTEDSESVRPMNSGVQASQSSWQALCQLALSSSPVLARSRRTRRKGRTSVSVKALLECLDISITPMVVVNNIGRAVYCNRSFEAFAAKTWPAGRTGIPSNVTEWPKVAGQSGSVRKMLTSDTNCAPEVQAWLDSDSVTLRKDIRVFAQPLKIGGDELTAFSIVDTSQENRTQLLERAFLHDLVNAAGSIQMLIDLLTTDTSRQERVEYVKLLQVSINRLLSEIYHEKMMLDSCGLATSAVNVHEILTALADYYKSQTFAGNCRIEIEEGAVKSMKVLGDMALLVRVLDNMLRNALEATSHGGIVTLGCRQIDGDLEFWVHNPNKISETVRTKIFKRSFSKPRDKGAQSYETELLSELCGGAVAVSSDQEFGTRFSIRYPAATETVGAQKRYRTNHAS